MIALIGVLALVVLTAGMSWPGPAWLASQATDLAGQFIDRHAAAGQGAWIVCLLIGALFALTLQGRAGSRRSALALVVVLSLASARFDLPVLTAVLLACVAVCAPAAVRGSSAWRSGSVLTSGLWLSAALAVPRAGIAPLTLLTLLGVTCMLAAGLLAAVLNARRDPGRIQGQER